jgi:predicted ATPase
MENREQQIRDMLQQVASNYNKLKIIINKIDRDGWTDNDEVLHQSVLKLEDIIRRRGYSGDNYLSYIVITARSIVYNWNKKSVKEIGYEDLISYIENDIDLIESDEWTDCYDILVDSEEDINKETKRIFIDTLFKTVFEYVEKNYNSVESGLFKYRFYTNYSIREISEMTGYTKNQVFTRTNKIMKDVKERFKNFSIIEE